MTIYCPDLTRCTEEDIARMDDDWLRRYGQCTTPPEDEVVRITHSGGNTLIELKLKETPQRRIPMRPSLLRELQGNEFPRCGIYRCNLIFGYAA